MGTLCFAERMSWQLTPLTSLFTFHLVSFHLNHLIWTHLSSSCLNSHIYIYICPISFHLISCRVFLVFPPHLISSYLLSSHLISCPLSSSQLFSAKWSRTVKLVQKLRFYNVKRKGRKTVVKLSFWKIRRNPVARNEGRTSKAEVKLWIGNSDATFSVLCVKTCVCERFCV